MSEVHPDQYLYDADEPIPGLPERPPEGERIIWQGKPSWKSLAVRSFHVRMIAMYFAILLVWDAISAVYDGDLGVVVSSMLDLAGLGAVVLSIVVLFCWAVERTTIYTITSRRVVIRAGIALPKTINVPFARIDRVDLNELPKDCGNILLTPMADDRLAYLVLWPHVQAWHFKQGRPMLRSVRMAAVVARILGKAIQDAGASANVTESRTPDARQGAPTDGAAVAA